VGTLITCSTGLSVLLYKPTVHWGWGNGGKWHAYIWPLSICLFTILSFNEAHSCGL